MSQSTVQKQKHLRTSSWSITKDGPTVECDHTWTINNFDQKLLMSNGECLKSGRFKATQQDRSSGFRLELYPNGKTIDEVGYVSVFLCLGIGVYPTPEEIKVQYSVVTNGMESNSKTVTYPFGQRHSDSNGFLKFLKHSLITLTACRSFTLRCQVSLLRASDVVSGNISTYEPILLKSFPTVVPTSKLSLDMTSLFESGELTDCVVVCGGTEIKCLKCILSARSSVFKAMFEHNTKEKRMGRVEINDLDYDTVYEMIFYIYSGNVSELKGKAASLLEAADKYDLMELKQICEMSLCENLSAENVCELLIVSKLHNCSILQSNALKFMKVNGKQIMSQAGWMDKLKHHPDLLSGMFETFVNGE